MEQQLTIPAAYIQAMLNQAEQRGIDRAMLLADIDLDMQALQSNQPCSAVAYGQLHHRIIQTSGDDWFGMLSGGSVPPGALRFMCWVAVQTKTLADAINECGRFFELCRGFKVKQSYSVEGDLAVSKIAKLDRLPEYEFTALIDAADPMTLKSTLAAWHGFLSWLVGREIPLQAMYYTFANQDDNKHRYEVFYQHDFCGYSYPAIYLTMPVIQQEQNIDEFLAKAPYYAFNRAAHSTDTVAQRVKSLMAKKMGSDLPQAMEIASSLHMSVTSLHRKLAQEASSFQKIKDETRMEAAILYLNSPNMSTQDVAALVGFDDPSTFSRSFKKWTGLPPGEYRKKLLSATAASDKL
ncbi:AraC family transcriptional regulator [Dasania sp. GY-MA-18]|uniref:AraC family transcriptional regulator ligand-binding domain-containing protein n=1 Tax=Dasania phycosphaerae TaxID=2950436 RepID=A0A9J6RKQ1_9GAMM|nr:MULTISPECIES: AraC family transcriptional regulator [Dasania]MCR8922549.1 AraC family transcriptional regulator [Dasania sp. GY-MA-18]MCZ0864978.1 AraC family transcriptional regulator ligand-binding domain-containing protein [Dasania phycosphaerae]MCZ0868705.1 AraC family transcriptional regulator ligand-binding domain-containing protein [Dasania phycosphaerae]